MSEKGTHVKPITLHVDFCISSGACVLECPEVFALGDDGVVSQIDPQPADDLLPKIRQAAAVCPVSVIEVADD
ncbi:ferredoxin [Amycolatopsis sp. K13G38]|uniref:Ferredoxin n=1 Tax=Amycolatopsis acididurans TaxID=2724524 RepID=A0ABX1JC03_9PSEU|nr:ferredoxin [Amycolatopsis acididurans]NKQ56135.1 ferredoxin [Amycolatopsis acididurans]